MLEYGLLFLMAGTALLVSTVRPDNVAMDQIILLERTRSTSHDELTLTRELMDEMRGYYDEAAEEVTGVEVGGSGVDRSVNSFIDHFNLQALTNDFRDAAGLTKFHITSEIVPDGDGIRFRARIFAIDRTDPVSVVSVRGKNNEYEPLLKEAALGIITVIDPYLAGIHLYHQEEAAGDFEFPKTRAMVESWLADPRQNQHYLALEVLGRIHRARAELDTRLDPAERTAELGTAAGYLKASLTKAPDLFGATTSLAAVYADLGQYGLADQYFDKAVRLDPNKLIARKKWAKVLAEQHRDREAIIQYVAAVELAPQDAALRDRLADLYVAVKRPDAARQQWLAALEIDPANQQVAEKLKALDP
jgi:tetratricopeptide (TPR) repeat protein